MIFFTALEPVFCRIDTHRVLQLSNVLTTIVDELYRGFLADEIFHNTQIMVVVRWNKSVSCLELIVVLVQWFHASVVTEQDDHLKFEIGSEHLARMSRNSRDCVRGCQSIWVLFILSRFTIFLRNSSFEEADWRDFLLTACCKTSR